jgi:hypothetical protein
MMVSLFLCLIMLSRDGVTTDEICIYWTLTDPWLQVIITVSLTHTLYSSLDFSACYVFTSLLVTASNSGRSPSSGFPNCLRPQLPASHSNSSQILNGSGPLTNSLPHSQKSHTQSQSYVTTDSQSTSLSWCQAPILGPRSYFCYCQTVACLLM